jgi:hypothetical protein
MKGLERILEKRGLTGLRGDRVGDAGSVNGDSVQVRVGHCWPLMLIRHRTKVEGQHCLLSLSGVCLIRMPPESGLTSAQATDATRHQGDESWCGGKK